MNDQQHQNEAACGGSALTAELDAELYAVLVGVKCYGVYRDKDYAIERAKKWAEKYPEAHTHVERRAKVWDDGKTWDLARVLRDGAVPNA